VCTSSDNERARFEAAARAATRLLDGEPDMAAVSLWAIGYVRGIGSRELRYAALDGILTALDEHEAQQ
jgi:hypothetical protein